MTYNLHVKKYTHTVTNNNCTCTSLAFRQRPTKLYYIIYSGRIELVTLPWNLLSTHTQIIPFIHDKTTSQRQIFHKIYHIYHIHLGYICKLTYSHSNKLKWCFTDRYILFHKTFLALTIISNPYIPRNHTLTSPSHPHNKLAGISHNPCKSQTHSYAHTDTQKWIPKQARYKSKDLGIVG